ncbi:hypothetical protein C8J57DRAFT_1297234 [Mycena rebaudengoi]|nr:hypothetical protein C8J57DRAFT_1297234 [Mycena rebaudengoi]
MKHVESEMSRHQRELVDVCLEEGQYESAIEVLSQLRSPAYRPSAYHIGVLLFMALYSDVGDTNVHFDPSSSPSKKAKKSHLLPSLAATLAAQQLLVSFATTNSPDAVLAALLPNKDDEFDNDHESFIATESLCISRCRNCWQILGEGFFNRNQPIFSTPKGRGKVDVPFTDISISELRSPVGETAWPVLDWLLIIFEKDECENSSLTQFSPLLLQHLGSPSRRDTDVPLAIVCHTLEQSDRRRRLMGARLLNLLINLSSAGQLDFPMLVVSVFNRLSTSSWDDLSLLLSSLNPSPAVSKFKIALYQKYLGDSTDIAKTLSRPRPQARAQLKGSPMKPRDPPQPAPLVIKHPALTSTDILRLMEANVSTNMGAAPSRIKFELLVSYITFQTLAPEADKDPQWNDLIHNGTLAKTLDTAFGCRTEATAVDHENYRELLNAMLSL